MRTKRVVVEKWNPQWKYEYEKIVASLGKDIIYNSIKIEMLEVHQLKDCQQNPS